VLGLAFVAAVQASASGQPGHRPLHHLAVAAQPGGGVDALASEAGCDATRTEPAAQVGVVVALVAMQLAGLPPTRPAAGADRRDTAHQRDEGLAVVGVGRGDPDREGQTSPVGDQVNLRAVLASIYRIRAGQ